VRREFVLRNTVHGWGWPAMVLHWLAAALILTMLGLGWWMTHEMLPRSPERLSAFTWHAALGYDLLVVMVLRILWRWSGGVPALPQESTRWERIAAIGGHALLYLFTFATALVGWMLAGTMRIALNKDLFGIPVPLIYANQDRAVHVLLENTHRYVAYALAALVAVHVAVALRHHFVKRNHVLRRMLSPATQRV
jgi:cytochrome b561